IFQTIVTIPGLKERAAVQSVVQIYESSYRVQGTTRSENISRIRVRPTEMFGLDFDFTPSKAFARYMGTLFDPTGKGVFTFGIDGDAANKELHLVIPGSIIQPGTYQVVIVGENEGKDLGPKGEEVQHLSFVIEFRP